MSPPAGEHRRRFAAPGIGEGMSVINATDADFASATSTGKPTLIDFHATWCGPCRQVGPVVEAIAAEHPEYTVVKVDVDQAPATAQQFGIRGVPFLVVQSADGTVTEQFNGPRPKGALVDALAAA